MKRLARAGFTLLEIIVTLVLLGVVAVMGTSFFTKGVTRTDVARDQLKTDAYLQLVLENMIQASREYTTNIDNANKMQDLYNNLKGSTNSSTSLSKQYGATQLYYVANLQFVCPNQTSKAFEPNGAKDQFLLITIKPNANAGVSLTYVFGATNNSKMTAPCDN